MNEVTENINTELDKQDKIRHIERIAGDLNNLILTAAMENARSSNENKKISEYIEGLKFITTEMLINGLYDYKANPEKSIWASTGDPNGRQKSIKGKLQDVVFDLVLLWAGTIEKNAILALKECMQIKAKPLSLCCEEIRKTALQLRSLAGDQSKDKRRYWIGSGQIELTAKPISNNRLELLSFDIGGLEFVEEFGYIKEILGYLDYIEIIRQNKNQPKIRVTDWLEIDYYVDLYELFKLPKPENEDDMQILVLEYASYNFEDKPYTETILTRVAFPIDFINFPFNTRYGKAVIPDCSETVKPFLKESWNWIAKEYTALDEISGIIRNNIHFLNWPKIIADTPGKK